MPIRFDDLGTVGTIAKKLQKKLGGRDEDFQQSAHAYHQGSQPYGYPQQAHYGPPQHHHAQHQHHQQPQYQYAPQAPRGQDYLSPHQHTQQPYPYQRSSPQPMPVSPRPIDSSHQRDNRTPWPSSTRPASASFHQSPGHDRLPPNAHIDLKTGQVQTNMFPPGYNGPLLQR